MNRFFPYLNFIIYPLIINKYHLFNIYQLPKLTTCKLEIVLRNIEKERLLEILDYFSLLELISGQRPVIKKFTSRHKLKKKTYFLVIYVTLRKFFLYDFIEYLSYFVFPAFQLNKKRIKTSFNQNKNYFCFFFNTFLFFFGIPFKDRIKLTGSLKLNFLFIKNTLDQDITFKIITEILTQLNLLNVSFSRKKIKKKLRFFLKKN